MRDNINKILFQLDCLKYKNPHIYSEMLTDDTYKTARYANNDYLGQLKNDLQWLIIGIEKAQEKLDETIQLGHKAGLSDWQLLEKIDDNGTEKLLLTSTWNKKRETLGIFNNIKEVKDYLNVNNM